MEVDEKTLVKMCDEAKARRDEAYKLMQEADGMYDEVAKAAGADMSEMTTEEMEAEEAKIARLEKAATLKKSAARKTLEQADRDIQYYETEIKAKKAAVLPADLPGQGQGGDPAVDDPSKNANGRGNEPTEGQKAFYQMRYGNMDAGVKAVIIDLYGNTYHQDRADQRKAFFQYVRMQDHLIDRRGWELLRKAIPTENFIKQAIAKGLDVSQIKTTMVEAVDTLGGFTVPVDMQEDIITRMPGFSVIRGRSRIRTTSRDRVQVVKRTGGDDQYVGNVRMTWAQETPANVAATETNATFGLEDIPVHKLMGVVPIAKDLLEDSAANLADELTNEFANAKAITEDNVFLIGSGIGRPRGIIVGGTTLTTGVASVNSGAEAALTFDGVIAMTFGIASQYKQGTRQGPNGSETSAVWIANRATYQALAQLTDGDGAYLWTELRGNNAVGVPNTLRGYNVLEQESMPDIAASAYPLLFGNPEAFTIVDRLGMTIQRYDVSPGQDTVHYESKFRVGGQVTHPWEICAQLVSS